MGKGYAVEAGRQSGGDAVLSYQKLPAGGGACCWAKAAAEPININNRLMIHRIANYLG